ncbi:MAG: virulence factor [Woeseiaceae bacterium]
MSVKKTLIYWRDIPSQVIVQRGRTREKALLSARFQEAIDRAAMRAGKGSSDAYMSEWDRKASRVESDDDLVEIAAAEVARLEAEFSDERLLELIRSHGSAGEN